MTRNYLGLNRSVDVVFVAVFLFWGLMLLVWTHQTIMEQMLRWVPALLAAPVWLPILLVSLAAMACVSAGLLILATVLMPLGAVVMIVGFVWSWWRWRHGITVRCIRGQCLAGNRRFRDLEIRYVCPGGCGAQYSKLTPSYFGILQHRCTCGATLPALAALRRRKTRDGQIIEQSLKKVCPAGHPWGLGAESLLSHFVAVAGGPSAGKTCYVTMALQSLLDSRHAGPRAKFELSDHAGDHEANCRALHTGRKLDPTQRGVPQATVLRLSGVNSESRLYLYDAAGEEYTSLRRDTAQEFMFFEDMTGIILIVDPLVLPAMRRYVEAHDEIVLRSMGGATRQFEEVVGGLTRYVRKFVRCGLSGRRDVPLAVVITKADVPMVSQRIGDCAIREAEEAHGSGGEHILCRSALVEWGAVNEVIALEQDFPKIRYFSCSPLGRAPDENDARPFVAQRVLPPLLWLLDGSRSQQGKSHG
jgi:hypothetical protein